ncbi:MAG TPA: alpha/beta fold hydrolase [Stellaceae bacterium]|nr:alpha/beta fold hydrolase [Stellaceae bacterium]
MKVDLEGGTVDALVKGEGRPLILLHSLLSDRGSWVRVEDELAKRFRVVIPALPGFGGSSAMTSSEGNGGGIAAIADRIAGLIRHVWKGGGEKPILLGNGFGSFVALQVAIRHPDLVGKLIVAAGGARFSEPGREALRNMANAAQAKGLAGIADVAMRRLFAPEYQDAHPELMADRRQAFLKTDPAMVQMASAELVAMDMSEAVKRIAVPLLVMCGEQDEATPPEMARELSKLVPNAKLVELPGCAHVPQLQKPQEFLAAISGFLA